MPIPLGVLAVAGAGGGVAASAYDLISTTVLSTAATVTFSDLLTAAADYKHLQIRALVQTNTSNTGNLNLTFRFNADTSSSYYNKRLNGNGSTVISEATVGGSGAFDLNDATPGFGTSTSIFGAVILDIYDFSDTSKKTTIRAFCGSYNGIEQDVSLQSGFYNKTNAIDVIGFTNTLSANTRISIYGIKG